MSKIMALVFVLMATLSIRVEADEQRPYVWPGVSRVVWREQADGTRYQMRLSDEPYDDTVECTSDATTPEEAREELAVWRDRYIAYIKKYVGELRKRSRDPRISRREVSAIVRVILGARERVQPVIDLEKEVGITVAEVIRMRVRHRELAPSGGGPPK